MNDILPLSIKTILLQSLKKSIRASPLRSAPLESPRAGTQQGYMICNLGVVGSNPTRGSETTQGAHQIVGALLCFATLKRNVACCVTHRVQGINFWGTANNGAENISGRIGGWPRRRLKTRLTANGWQQKKRGLFCYPAIIHYFCSRIFIPNIILWSG